MPVEYIDIHTHHRSEDVLSVVSYGLGRDDIPDEPHRPFSAGIHPWDAAGILPERLSDYFEYLGQAPLAAVGECGLDYTRGGEPGKQKAVLVAQLDIAQNRSLPVVIHCVKAYNDLLPILLNYPKTDFILHGFTGSPELAHRVLDTGCYISFGERSLRSEKTLRALEIVPLDRIFAETDESSEPIVEIYKRIAEVKKTALEELAGIIKDNYDKVFK